jgi:hypothetical protein
MLAMTIAVALAGPMPRAAGLESALFTRGL